MGACGSKPRVEHNSEHGSQQGADQGQNQDPNQNANLPQDAQSGQPVERADQASSSQHRPAVHENQAPEQDTPRPTCPYRLPNTTNRKMYALLIGCNYEGTPFQLNGCINDVKTMVSLLKRHYNMRSSEMTVLKDDTMGFRPTGARILGELSTLIRKAKKGDSLVVYYSGHGTQGHHQNGSNRLGALDEAIVPADLNLIFAQDLRMILNKQLPRSVKFTMIADSCNSANLLLQEHEDPVYLTAKQGARFVPIEDILDYLSSTDDKEGLDQADSDRLFNVMKRKFPRSIVSWYVLGLKEFFPRDWDGNAGKHLRIILLAACKQNEYAIEQPETETESAGGLFTGRLIHFIRQQRAKHPTLDVFSNEILFNTVSDALKHLTGGLQHPCLDVNSEVDARALFLLTDDVPPRQPEHPDYDNSPPDLQRSAIHEFKQSQTTQQKLEEHKSKNI